MVKSSPKTAAKKLATKPVASRRSAPAKGKPKPKIETTETAVAMEKPPKNKRAALLKEFADNVSALSEKVDKAEKSLNAAKETLTQERSEFNKLSKQLREATKLLADLTAGRAVPRDLFSNQ